MQTETTQKTPAKPWNAYDAFKGNAQPADSVADFLDRYYKKDRYTGRGADYAAVLLASYTEQYEKEGFCYCSHHDSNTGEVAAWYGPEKAIAETPKVHSYTDETPDAWNDFIAAMHSGEVVEIDEEMYFYWLEVLPPKPASLEYGWT